MKNKMTFETYPPMFDNYDDYIENDRYDDEIMVFTIPMGWAIDWIFIHYRMGLEDFLHEYTWDDTYGMYNDAISEGVVIDDHIEDRRGYD